MDLEQFDSFEKEPDVSIDGYDEQARSGWNDVTAYLNQLVGESWDQCIVAVECYPGVDEETLSDELARKLNPDRVFQTGNAFRSDDEIDELVEPFLGGDDPIFGYMSNLRMHRFLNPETISSMRESVQNTDGPVLVVGAGATCIYDDPDVLVYADLARWEIQQRQRADRIGNLGVENHSLDASLQFKRAFFVDWRVADRLKEQVLPVCDVFLDLNNTDEPKLVSGDAFRDGLKQTTTQPFSLVPFFDPGTWGGQWMRDTFDLDDEPPNFAWCFNCVPEENSLLLHYGDVRIETPAMNLVLLEPVNFMGPHVYSLFGAEFPIRFDYLDTMDGQNLSLQVHPTMKYIQDEFGVHYTQDESYYLMDAGEEGTVYLGLQEDVDPDKMIEDLENARDVEDDTFDAGQYVNEFPVDKHDHVSIPAGTIHCSGEDSMVLEISATPYIFTFKLWDWNRVGLDGEPRPINVERGKHVIQWDRRTEWVREHLMDRTEKLDQGEEWVEERTGLHELEFIETRRHWFTGEVPHDTEDTVHVLNLVEGEQAIVESPEDAFDPFVVHYGETFLVPAQVGSYTIRPHGPSKGKECATIKAFVR